MIIKVLNTSISSKESESLNFIREISAVFIVICHLLQHSGGYPAAWIFNVAVQIFFFMSGYLYGSKENIDTIQFYKKRIVKVYLPYFIYITIVILVLTAFSNALTIKQIIGAYLCRIPLPFSGHLWFITALFLYYFTLPFIANSFKKNHLSTFILFIFFGGLIYIYNWTYCIWYILFYLGFLSKKYDFTKKLCYPALIISILIPVILGKDLNIKSDNFPNIIFHFALGTFLFSFMLKYINGNITKYIIWKGYSYEIFLVHVLFLLGPLSVLHLTPYGFINIIIFLILAYTAAVLLSIFSKSFAILSIRSDKKNINKNSNTT